jgi:adenine-specific DNA glycosylase
MSKVNSSQGGGLCKHLKCPQGWTAQQAYDHHEVMMLHGQKCCYYRNPECDRCLLLTECPSGKTERNRKSSRRA